MDDLTQEFLAESQEGLDRMERCLTELESRPDDRELVAEIFRAVHTIKGTTGFLGLPRLEKLSHVGENLLGALRDGKLAVTEGLISGLLQLLDGLRSVLKVIEITGGEGRRPNDNDTALIVMLESLLSNDAAGVGEGAGVVEAECADPVAAACVPETATNDRTLRIDVEVLNRMMNLVGDLVLTRNQILQSDLSAGKFPELTRRLDGITADLRETVMQARMQPVANLFNKFPRMVRDLALTCGRSVRLEFTGQETGLDKSLLEAIKGPLMHAVRNAVDHGIEASADRVLAGKPVEGCVRLKAFHQGGSVVIEVSDDGAGIGMERVLAKAIERELVTAEQASTMTERETLQLIFLPGFSTASTVTHVSGRGVGMDVVRANVESVGGSVELESQVGVGTTLRLRIPLTLAIVPALVIRSGGQSFALPQNALMELIYVPSREAAGAVERMGGAEFYRLRERLLPLVWLDRLLTLPVLEERGTGFYMAVLEAEGRRYGLVVDDLLAPEEIVVKPLSDVLRGIGLFSGATVLGNGTLALILDVAEMAERAGVKAREVSVIESGEEIFAKEASASSFLVFEEHVRERRAVPLHVVERIESIPLREIEHVKGRPLLQYRGENLELRDEGGVLEEMLHASADDGVPVTILICKCELDTRGSVGIVVRQVLDVSVGTVSDDGHSTGDAGLVLVGKKLTALCGGGSPGTPWREVA